MPDRTFWNVVQPRKSARDHLSGRQRRLDDWAEIVAVFFENRLLNGHDASRKRLS